MSPEPAATPPDSPPSPAPDFPMAEVREGSAIVEGLRRHASRLWILTGLCLVVAIILLFTINRVNGTRITVRFEQGHGIKPGDRLRHRGIEVGEVMAVGMNDDLAGVILTIVLEPAASGLAREGSRFWIERPRFSLARVSGLDTVVGSKYLGVLPGPADARPQSDFVGDEAPLTVLYPRVLEITIRFRDGYGLQVGDELKHRGIVVGEVVSVELNPELSGVTVQVRLVESAQRLARAGSQFWIERPDVSFTGVRGLETIVGGRYLAVLPGPAEAEPLLVFDGLEAAPVTGELPEGGLEIILEGQQRHGVQLGAPVLYRGHQIGRILSVGLSADASRIEARAFIDPKFRRLIRDNSVFWSVKGIKANFSIAGGLEISAETLATIAAGGVSLATPDMPGQPVSTGHRFTYVAKPDERWLEWQPHIPLGVLELPDGLSMPQPLRASLQWQETRFGFTRSRQTEAWVLPLAYARILAPLDLLAAPESALPGSTKLAVAGREIAIDDNQALLTFDRIAALRLPEPLPQVVGWTTQRVRRPTEVEDLIIVGDTPDASFPLPAGRLSTTASVHVWSIDPSFAIDGHMHGACAVSSKDGAVVGLVLVDRGQSSVALIPADLFQ